MVNYIILLLFSFFITEEIKFTPQSPDLIWYKGELYPLHEQPLRNLYFNRQEFRNEIDDREFYYSFSSGCWQGFIAEWELTDNGELYLLHVHDCDSYDMYYYLDLEGIVVLTGNPFTNRVYLKNIFGDRVQDGKVKATWFNGYLKIPIGKSISSYYGGYMYIYADYHNIPICDGNVLQLEE